ncbi:hypothetical protein BST61_g5642 [Cercospora zeina]
MMRKITINARFRDESVVKPDVFEFCIQLGDSNHSCSVELTKVMGYKYNPKRDSHFKPLEAEVRAALEVTRHRTKDQTPQLKLEDLGVSEKFRDFQREATAPLAFFFLRPKAAINTLYHKIQLSG